VYGIAVCFLSGHDPSRSMESESGSEILGDSAAAVGGSRQPDRREQKRLPPRETAVAECGRVVKVGLFSYQH